MLIYHTYTRINMEPQQAQRTGATL